MTFAVLSGIELLLVGAIVLMMFGAGWLPKLARKAGHTKVQVDAARAELDKAKGEITAPIKGATDFVAKVDRTINVKPTDIVRRMVTPTNPAVSNGSHTNGKGSHGPADSNDPDEAATEPSDDSDRPTDD